MAALVLRKHAVNNSK